MLLLVALSAAGASDRDVTVLEPFVVFAAAGPTWRYFEVPGYEVLSRCPDGFNERYARALRRCVAARAALLPAECLGSLPAPMRILLYCREPAPAATLARSAPIDLHLAPVSDALRGTGDSAMASPVVVGDGDTFTTCGNYWNVISDVRDLTSDPDTDMRLQLRTPALPAWFRAGVTGPYGVFTYRIDRTNGGGRAVAVLPNALWVSRAQTIALQQDPRSPREHLPLAELFAESGRGARSELWESEAGLLVRWGLCEQTAEGASRRSAFLRFVDQASRAPVTETLFRECLGSGYGEVEQQLDRYLGQAVATSITLPLAADVPEAPVDIRDATVDEIARIIGDWERCEGRERDDETMGSGERNYRRECRDHAARLLEQTYDNGIRTPSFLATYGLYKARSGDEEAARISLEAAVDAGVVRPRAYLELARLRFERSLPYGMRGIGDLREEDFSAILKLVTMARQQMPSLLENDQLLARVLEHAPTTPTREELAALREAVARFPRNTEFAATVAALYQQFGYPDEARTIRERARPFR